MKLKDVIDPDVTLTSIEAKCSIPPQLSAEMAREIETARDLFIAESIRQEKEGGERANTKYKKLFTQSPVNYISALLQDAEWNTPQELVLIVMQGVQYYMDSIVMPQLRGDKSISNILSLLEALEKGDIEDVRNIIGKGGQA